MGRLLDEREMPVRILGYPPIYGLLIGGEQLEAHLLDIDAEQTGCKQSASQATNVGVTGAGPVEFRTNL